MLVEGLIFSNEEIVTIDIGKTGVYQYNLDGRSGQEKAPVPAWPWGTLAVFGGMWGIIQFATTTEPNNKRVYIRGGRGGGETYEFNDWSTIP